MGKEWEVRGRADLDTALTRSLHPYPMGISTVKTVHLSGHGLVENNETSVLPPWSLVGATEHAGKLG